MPIAVCGWVFSLYKGTMDKKQILTDPKELVILELKNEGFNIDDI